MVVAAVGIEFGVAVIRVAVLGTLSSFALDFPPLTAGQLRRMRKGDRIGFFSI